MKQYTLSKILTTARNFILPRGNLEGICAFCGIKDRNLLQLELSKLFTAYEFIHDTGLICPECRHLYKNAEYRNHAWFCSESKFKFLKRFEVLQTILQNCEIPYAIYTSDTYKKQGWLTILKKVNYSLNQIIIAWDMKLIIISKRRLIELIKIGRKYQKFGLTKTEILTGKISFKNLKKMENEERTNLNQLYQLKNNLNWMWVIGFLPALKDGIKLLKDE